MASLEKLPPNKGDKEMKKLLILSTALSSVAFIAAADEITVVSWGGAYATS